jgi:hypothetical protein
MLTPDFYLGDTASPAYVLNFDGRVRSCFVLGRPVIVRGDERYPVWHVRVDPPLPAEWGDLADVVIMESDRRDIATLDGEEFINVVVYYMSNRPVCGHAPSTSPDELTFDDLARLYDFARVANDPSHLDLRGWLFQDELGRGYTHEGFIAHLREEHGLELRVTQSETGGETLETLDTLRLAQLHAALHYRERRLT